MGPEARFASVVLITIYVWVRFRHVSLFPKLSSWLKSSIKFRRYYGAMVPSLICVTISLGFVILGSIVGGQALASIANISWS